MFLITAFTVGLFGSLHCVGMCGPIALAIPLQGLPRNTLFRKTLGYHLGRSLTYASLGLLIGLGGEAIRFAGMQRWFAFLTGVTLILIALLSLPIENKLNNTFIIRRLVSKVRSLLNKVLSNASEINTFRLGMLNGLLPCGLVYLALVGAMSLGTLWQSVLYMFLFGLGTAPLLIFATMGGGIAGASIRNKFRRAYPYLLILLAILFISRALNFDVPPEMNFFNAMNQMPMCH